MKAVNWIRLGTGSLTAAATLAIAVIVYLDHRASRNESRIHDAKLNRLESAVIENGGNIAVLNEQMKALFERQGEVLDRFDNAATKAEAENAALEAENASLKRDRELARRISVGEERWRIIQHQVGENAGEIETLKASFGE